jgi:hypothetical protein
MNTRKRLDAKEKSSDRESILDFKQMVIDGLVFMRAQTFRPQRRRGFRYAVFGISAP